MTRMFSLLGCALMTLSAIAEDPSAQLLESRGRNRRVQIGNDFTLSVPPEWSIAGPDFSSPQSDSDALGPIFLENWNPHLAKAQLLRLERISDMSAKRPFRSTFTISFLPNAKAAAAAETRRSMVIAMEGLDILVSPSIKTRKINGRIYSHFRASYGQVVDDYLFTETAAGAYFFDVSETLPYALPTANVSTLLGRIQFAGKPTSVSARDQSGTAGGAGTEK